MSTDLAKLNRLRVNAGKTELKSWKASQAKLAEAIKALEDAGHTDALPGANVDAAPVIEDPEIAKARPEPEDDKAEDDAEDDAPKSLADSAMAKNIGTTDDPKPKSEPKKAKAHLARGLDTDQMARQSRLAVRMQREKEKREEKEAKKNKPKVTLSDADKRQIADEAKSRKPKIAGEIDAKKDPEGAKRQRKHVEDKQKARAESGKKPKEKNANEVTVAEVARELNIDPKVARAKMRRYEGKPGYPKTVKGERWTFPMSAKAEVVKILK